MIVNGYKSKAEALRYLASKGYRMAGLLSKPDSNPKVAKNGKLGVLSAPLHLAPFDLSGFQVCPQASKGCAAACLHTAGNPAYMAGKDASRKMKTRAYFKEREAFMAVLFFDIKALELKAVKKGMQAAIRLNATSDLPWEHREIRLEDNGQTWVEKIMDAFPAVQFYDYTKVTKRALAFARGDMPENYHLTFSKTEDNDEDCNKVLEQGGNVAVVCSSEVYTNALKTGSLPYPYDIPAVIDGDETDYRPSDPDLRAGSMGVVVALKAKGDARNDTSGFTLR